MYEGIMHHLAVSLLGTLLLASGGYLIFGQTDVAPDPNKVIGGLLGGTGLVGFFLWWLMFYHLPSRDKQSKESMEAQQAQFHKTLTDKTQEHKQAQAAKDKQIEALIKTNHEEREIAMARLERLQASYVNLNANHIASMDTARREFAVTLDKGLEKVVNHCMEENQKQRDSWVYHFNNEIDAKIRKEVIKQLDNDGSTLSMEDQKLRHGKKDTGTGN